MIALGCDHGGFGLKQAVKKYLEEKGLEYKDFGTYSEESCDYPVYGEAVARAVASGECDRGIIICGTGIGISIAANKVPASVRLCATMLSLRRCAENITTHRSCPWAHASLTRLPLWKSWISS